MYPGLANPVPICREGLSVQLFREWVRVQQAQQVRPAGTRAQVPQVVEAPPEVALREGEPVLPALAGAPTRSPVTAVMDASWLPSHRVPIVRCAAGLLPRKRQSPGLLRLAHPGNATRVPAPVTSRDPVQVVVPPQPGLAVIHRVTLPVGAGQPGRTWAAVMARLMSVGDLAVAPWPMAIRMAAWIFCSTAGFTGRTWVAKVSPDCRRQAGRWVVRQGAAR